VMGMEKEGMVVDWEDSLAIVGCEFRGVTLIPCEIGWVSVLPPRMVTASTCLYTDLGSAKRLYIKPPVIGD
jgi:hypothetical protein